MPHGESWITVLLGPFYERLEKQANALAPNDTWIAGAPLGVEHVLAWTLVLVLIALAGGLVARGVRDRQQALIPEERFSIRTIFELLIGSTYDTMSDMMGPKAAKFFLPLIGTCAVTILVSNFLGLIPGFIPPTDDLNTTFACALIIFFATHIFGVKENGIGYFKDFFGPIRKWYALPLMLLMLVIETVSHIARPVTLAIRLAANMTADHKVLAIFTGFGIWSVIVPFPLPLYALGVLVAAVQTLVFCLLSIVYISMAISHEEH